MQSIWEGFDFSYLLGEELLVAPVVKSGEQTRRVYLPRGAWVHLWSGERFTGGEITVEAPMGKIPVFYREGCEHEALFRILAEDYR